MKQKNKSLPSYQKLVHGYLGFLTGTGKSLSTIASYKGDLGLLEDFLRVRKKDFYQLLPRDFAAYQAWLERQGLRTNTRRRKILSAKSLVKYAVSRKKMPQTDVRYVRAPERLERLPWIPLPAEARKLHEQLETKTPLGTRNALLVHLLAETGMTVAELCGLRWDQLQEDSLELTGRRARALRLSADTLELLSAWRKQNEGKFLFPGFNRHGVTSERMTPRGVELFFRRLAGESRLRWLKPKTLRHFAVANWLREGVAESEIQRRLGVNPNYSLDAYRKHVESR